MDSSVVRSFAAQSRRLERRSDLVDDRACTSVRKGRHEPLAQLNEDADRTTLPSRRG